MPRFSSGLLSVIDAGLAHREIATIATSTSSTSRGGAAGTAPRWRCRSHLGMRSPPGGRVLEATREVGSERPRRRSMPSSPQRDRWCGPRHGATPCSRCHWQARELSRRAALQAAAFGVTTTDGARSAHDRLGVPRSVYHPSTHAKPSIRTQSARVDN